MSVPGDVPTLPAVPPSPARLAAPAAPAAHGPEAAPPSGPAAPSPAAGAAAMAPATTLSRFAPRRLWQRIVLLFLGLLLAVQAAGFLVIRESIERNARATLARELGVAERIWRQLLAQKAHALAQSTAVLAADFGFRSTIGSGDGPTIESALENHAGRIGATASAWVGVDGTVQAVHAEDAAVRAALPGVAASLAQGPTAGAGQSTAAVVQGRPLQLVAVPVRAPLPIGSVVLGFPVDQALIDDLHQLSGMHAVLFSADPDGRPRVVARSFTGPTEGLAGQRGDTLVLDGEAMALRRVPLIEAQAGAELMLLHSIDAAVAPYRELQWLLAAITLLGVAVFGVGSRVTARRVTQPLQTLVQASERLGQGDYAQPLPAARRDDEVGELTVAFEQMRGRIAAHAQEVHRLAYWDALTGLPNRARFRALVQQAIDESRPAAGPRTPLSVALLDLDRFKHVNDVLGYALGDRLLQGVARRLAGLPQVRAGLLARLNGGAFALLLPGEDAAQAVASAERLARALETPFVLDEQTVDVTAAFGVASWPLHGDDADALLNRAEVAMYSAKRLSASVVAYDPSIDNASAQTLSLLSDLRRALERDELRLLLQPKVALSDGRLIGAEALVRWQHPVRGMVPPMAFIPFAEQTGFVRQLTLWVFEQAVRAWGPLRGCGVECISVNLSTRDLMDHDLPGKLATLLQRHGAPAEGFCLEITESAIMDDPDRARTTLLALSGAGFRLSIDDFGTGYSSLAYLQRLPVHELKIDRSFVQAMDSGAEGAEIVRFTIDLAHTLGLSVVAEGVENAELLAELAALGCDEAQGYHVSRPIAPDAMPAFAQRWAARGQPAVASSVAVTAAVTAGLTTDPGAGDASPGPKAAGASAPTATAGTPSRAPRVPDWHPPRTVADAS